MLTCRSGGDVITRHNQLRDCIADFCHKACLSPQIEKGSGILPKDQSNSEVEVRPSSDTPSCVIRVPTIGSRSDFTGLFT